MDPINIAGTHRDEYVSWLCLIVYCCHGLVKRTAETDMLTLAGNIVGQILTHMASAVAAPLSGGENWHNQDAVGVRKASRKLREQVLGSGDLMRLKDAEHPAAREFFARRSQRLPHGGRVVGVVINQRHSPPGADQLETAPNSAEFGQRLVNLRRRQTQAGTHGGRG